MRYWIPLLLLSGGCCCCTVGPGDQQQLREEMKITSYSDANDDFDERILPICETLADEFGAAVEKGSIRPSVRPNTDFERIVTFTTSEADENSWKANCELHFRKDKWVYINSDISPTSLGKEPFDLCQELKRSIEQSYGPNSGN